MTPAPLPLWAIPLLPLGIVGFFLLVSYLLGTVSGWRRLAAKFPAPKGAAGSGIGFCSASFDFGVSYNNCLTLEATEHGLLVRVIPPFSFTHPPLLLPWETLRTEATRLLWFRRVRVGLVSGGEAVGSFSLAHSDAEALAALAPNRFRLPMSDSSANRE